MFFHRGRVPEKKTVLTACRLAGVLMLATLQTAALAQSRLPLTITEARELAVQQEPGVAQLRAIALALKEQSVAAAQLPDPKLRIGLLNYPLGSGDFSTEGMTQAQLGIRQEFPREGLRTMTTNRFLALAAAEESGANARSRAVIQATRTAWLDAFYWQQAEQLLRESRPLFQDLLSVAESLYAVGRNAQSDVLRAELELKRLDDRLIKARKSQARAQARLSEWLGADAFRPAAATLPDWGELPSLPQLQAGLARHPLLHAAEATIDAGQASVGAAEEKGKTGWALDLGYGYREGFLPSGEPRSDFISLSVIVDLPFFKKNRQDRDLAAALHQRSAAVSAKTRLAADLQSQLQVSHTTFTELSERLALYETTIVALTRQQADAALLAYQSDTGDFSGVMLGRIDLVNTELEYLRLQVERAQAYAVLANLGGLE